MIIFLTLCRQICSKLSGACLQRRKHIIKYFQFQIHNMSGHNGGVTGVQIQTNIAASSSYDSTVRCRIKFLSSISISISISINSIFSRLWDVERGECVLVLTNSDSFCRCIAFTGNRQIQDSRFIIFKSIFTVSQQDCFW